MNTGNDNHPSHTRGWYRMLSLKGVPRSLPRSGVPQTSDAKCGGPRVLKSSSLRLSARGCCTLSCVGHLTATTVRVGVFMSGVLDALKSTQSRTRAGVLDFGPRSCSYSPECVEGGFCVRSWTSALRSSRKFAEVRELEDNAAILRPW